MRQSDHTVLLAQTKVGFLTGGRKKSFRLLSEDEQMVQLEEAYARATVAITATLGGSLKGSPGSVQYQTSLLESSAIPQVLHLQTELGSKAQTKLEMMLDGTDEVS